MDATLGRISQLGSRSISGPKTSRPKEGWRNRAGFPGYGGLVEDVPDFYLAFGEGLPRFYWTFSTPLVTTSPYRLRRVYRIFTGNQLDIYLAIVEDTLDFYRTLPTGPNLAKCSDHCLICSMGEFDLALAEDVPGFDLALNPSDGSFTGLPTLSVPLSKQAAGDRPGLWRRIHRTSTGRPGNNWPQPSFGR